MLLSTEEADPGEIGPDAVDDRDVDKLTNPGHDDVGDGDGGPCDDALASTRFIRETDLVKHSTAC